MNKHQEAIIALQVHFPMPQVIAIERFIDFCLEDHQAEIDDLQRQVEALEKRLDNI